MSEAQHHQGAGNRAACILTAGNPRAESRGCFHGQFLAHAQPGRECTQYGLGAVACAVEDFHCFILICHSGSSFSDSAILPKKSKQIKNQSG
jgi:hypothetical protein